MNNTAKLSNTIVNEFQEAHKTTEFLRNFLITSASDAGKTYEMLDKFRKYASEENKVKFTNAIKLLEDITIRRVEITANVFLPGDYENLPEVEEPKKVIQMYISLEDVLQKVQKIMLDNPTSTSRKEAYEELKLTVGNNNKVKDSNGKIVLWDNAKINAHLDLLDKESKKDSPKEEKNEKTPEHARIGFKTILGFAEDMVKNNKDENVVKNAIKKYIIGKIVTSDSINTFIVNDDVFENFYKNAIEAYVKNLIINLEKKEDNKTIESKLETVEKKIEEEVKPMLEELEKANEKFSLSKATKHTKNIYVSSGIMKTLSDSLLKVLELAKKYTPNLYSKYKDSTKDNKPIEPIKDKVEIFDNSYNVSEANKPLWKEVENYTDFTELFNKADKLTKAGNWKDALSMCIILISSGKIKEKKEDKETIQWTEDQIKNWFYTNILKETVVTETSAKAEEKTEIKVEEKTTETEPVVGPVAKAGFTANVEQGQTTKLIKDLFIPKDKNYSFKSIEVPTTHHVNKMISFQVVDATIEQEPKLLVTEINFTNFLNSLHYKLVKTGNNFPVVKQELRRILKEYYTIQDSEIKHILMYMSSEAHEIRKKEIANKKSSSENPQAKAEETNTVNDISKDEEGTLYFKSLTVGEPIFEKKDGKKVRMQDETVSTNVSENMLVDITIVKGVITQISEPYLEKEEEEEKETETIAKESNSPLVEKVEEEKTEKEVKSQDTTHTEATVGESSINSNKEEKEHSTDPYKGFEDIVQAKDKLSAHKAIFAKINEFSDIKEGTTTVFDVINKLRKDGRYKKSFVRNWKTANETDLRKVIDNIVTNGLEIAKRK